MGVLFTQSTRVNLYYVDCCNRLDLMSGWSRKTLKEFGEKYVEKQRSYRQRIFPFFLRYFNNLMYSTTVAKISLIWCTRSCYLLAGRWTADPCWDCWHTCPGTCLIPRQQDPPTFCLWDDESCHQTRNKMLCLKTTTVMDARHWWMSGWWQLSILNDGFLSSVYVCMYVCSVCIFMCQDLKLAWIGWKWEIDLWLMVAVWCLGPCS